MSTRTPVQRMADAAAEIREIADKPVLSTADEARLSELGGQFDEAEREHRNTNSRLSSDPLGEPRSIERRKYQEPWSINRDNSLVARNASPKEFRERALSAIEQMPGASDETRENASRVIEEFDDKQSRLARTALLTSDPDYLRAWSEMLKSGGSNPILSEDEVQAMRRVQAEQRAMSLTDDEGGYLVPFQLDPAVIITSDGSINPLRQVSRRVVATGDKWNGVSAGATEWSWDAEAEQVSDDASTFAQPAIDIHAARGFIPISYEALMDEANVTQEVGRLLAFGRSTLEETAFVTGSGSGEPFGIVTALNGVAGSVVDATTDDTYQAADIYKVSEDLPGRYHRSGRSAWLANIAIWNDTDLFETSNGSKLHEGVVPGQSPGSLLGSPTYEAEAMDGTIASGDDYVLVFGDFDNYVIADRFSSVEFIPHLFGANQRPTGQRGIFGFFRMGADSVNDAAFRLLKV